MASYSDVLFMSVLREEWDAMEKGELMTHHLSREIKVYGDIKLYAGTGSPELAQKISDYLQSPLCGRDVVRVSQ